MFNVLKLVESTDWIINLMYMFLMMKETGAHGENLQTPLRKAQPKLGFEPRTFLL